MLSNAVLNPDTNHLLSFSTSSRAITCSIEMDKSLHDVNIRAKQQKVRNNCDMDSKRWENVKAVRGILLRIRG